MARLELDKVYGVSRSQIVWRNRGVEIAPRDRHRPLRKLKEPLTLHGVHIGDFAVTASAILPVRLALDMSLLITNVDRVTQQAEARPANAILENPDKLCTPYLRFVLGELSLADLAVFKMTELSEFASHPNEQAYSPE